MAFKRLFGDFADKNLSDLWAELNRRIEAGFSESGGGLVHFNWATDEIAADGVEKAVGVDGSLLARSPGFTWGGVGGQSDKPVQVGQTFTPKRVSFAVDDEPGVAFSFTAGILVNGVVFVQRTFLAGEQNSFIEVFPPGDILEDSLVSAFVARSGDAASSRCVVTFVGKAVTL